MGTPENQVSFASLTPEKVTEQLSIFIGAPSGKSFKGLVPAPNPSDGLGLKALFDDGAWKTPAGGGGALLAANNLSDVANPATARANLGIVSLLSLSPTLLGNNVANTFVIPHGMGTANVIPHVKKVSTGDKANCTVRTDATNITIIFAGTPPTLNEFSLIAIGF